MDKQQCKAWVETSTVAIVCLAGAVFFVKSSNSALIVALVNLLILTLVYRHRLIREARGFGKFMHRNIQIILGLTLSQQLRKHIESNRPLDEKVRLGNRMFGLPDEEEIRVRKRIEQGGGLIALKHFKRMLELNQSNRVAHDERLALLILYMNHYPTSPEFLYQHGVSPAAIRQLIEWGWIEEFQHNHAYYVLTTNGELAARNQCEKKSIAYTGSNLEFPAGFPELYRPGSEPPKKRILSQKP